MTDTATTWSLTCNYCGTGFDTPTPRPFCTIRCRDRSRWYGPTVPAAHKQYAARTARTNPKPEGA